MRRLSRPTTALLALVLLGLAAGAREAPAGDPASPPGMAWIRGGQWRSFYPQDRANPWVPVAGFFLDRLPVTQGDFLAFVRAHPQWRRDRVSPLFADPGYLGAWAGPDTLGPAVGPRQPATRVSWFAAKAYCAARGARLADEAEWEYAAQATDAVPDGSGDPVMTQRILDWYSRPNPKVLPDVGLGPPNFWGIGDLHGLVWEWVADFNSSLVSGDARESGDADTARYCGSGALAAADAANYASFMRFAFRSSLDGKMTTPNLGFRCARDR